MANLLLIVNPAAGRGLGEKRTTPLLRLLKAAGCSYDLRVTEGPGDAYWQARLEYKRHDTIAVLGGDGSVQEVAAGLAAVRLDPTTAPAASLPRLGVLPAGTGNDFIKAAGIPEDLDAAFAVLLEGRTRELDLGRVQWRSAGEDEQRERIFVNNVGLGFEGRVGWEAQRIRLPVRGLPLYLIALIRVLKDLDNPPMRIRFGSGEEMNGAMLLISAGNGHTSGGGFRLNPCADPFDGLLDVCAVSARSRRNVLRLLPRALNGTHTTLSGVACRRDSRLELESAVPCHGHADGELLGAALVWARVEILPRLLTLICRLPGGGISPQA